MHVSRSRVAYIRRCSKSPDTFDAAALCIPSLLLSSLLPSAASYWTGIDTCAFLLAQPCFMTCISHYCTVKSLDLTPLLLLDDACKHTRIYLCIHWFNRSALTRRLFTFWVSSWKNTNSAHFCESAFDLFSPAHSHWTGWHVRNTMNLGP